MICTAPCKNFNDPFPSKKITLNMNNENHWIAKVRQIATSKRNSGVIHSDVNDQMIRDIFCKHLLHESFIAKVDPEDAVNEEIEHWEDEP